MKTTTMDLNPVVIQRMQVKWLQQTVRMAQTIHHHSGEDDDNFVDIGKR